MAQNETTKEEEAKKRDPDYWLGDTAESVYLAGKPKRDALLDEARELGALTLPHIALPDGYQEGDSLGYNNQSEGAHCVNTLASKIMYMMLPPERPAMKFDVLEWKVREKELKEDPSANPDTIQQLITKVNGALSVKEMAHKKRFESTLMRTAATQYILHHLIAGNALWEHEGLNNPVVYGMDKYIVKRDKMGRQVYVVLEDTMDYDDLPDDIKEQADIEYKDQWEDTPPWSRTVPVHKVTRRKKQPGDWEDGKEKFHWVTWVEWKGQILEGTQLHIKSEWPNLYAGWLIPLAGKDWGRSYCSQYRGDLYAVENYSSSIQDMAAAAAFTLTVVNPAGQTNIKMVRNAKNLDVIPGRLDDVGTLRADKGGDASLVANAAESASRRLGRAFLTMGSIQRSGERVTAEELKLLAKELDEAMGGLYSQLAQTSQLHIIMRALELHGEEDGTMEKLPEEIVSVTVSTGVDALGRSHEGEALVQSVATIGQTVPNALRRIDDGEYARRVFAANGVNHKGLLKEAPAVEQQDQQMANAAMTQAAAPGVAQEAAKAAFGGMRDVTVPQMLPQGTQSPTQQ